MSTVGRVTLDVAAMEKIAEAAMKDRRDRGYREPGWILYHGRRVGNIAVHLSEIEHVEVSPDVLRVAGFFHDIGKGENKHHKVGARRTRDLLKDEVSPSVLDAICDLVHGHNRRDLPNDYPDAVKLIQDADLVDHAGVIDIWSACYRAGTQGSSFLQHLEDCHGEHRQDYWRYVDEHLNFDASRQLVAERSSLAGNFLAELRRIYVEGV